MKRKACAAGIAVLVAPLIIGTACSGVRAGGRGGTSPGSGFSGGGTTVVAPSAKGIGFSVPTFPWLSRTEQLAWLKDFRRLGISWIRFGITWAVVQPVKHGPYHWARYDRAVAEADAAGIHVDAQADFSARWAETRGCRAAYEECQPSSPRLFAVYAGAIARHFGHGVSAEEIWNEPNNVTFWHPAPNPRFYVRMLRDSYRAIKAADPQMVVVSGGLAPERGDGTGIPALTFARDLFRYGAKGYFDALGDHPYSYPALPDQYEPWSAWSQLAQTTPSLRSVLAANGETSVPVWLTEVGAPTGGPGPAVGCDVTARDVPRTGHDSPCLQAEAVTQVVRNERSLPWAGPAFLYSFQDLGTDQRRPGDFFGIVTAQGKAKPSYAALRRADRRGRP